MLNIIIENINMILLFMGFLTFLVTVVVEVTKNIGFLNRIPTDIYVLGLSVLFSVLSYFVYVSYSQAKVIWYFVVGAVILGFLVSYVAMFGWEKFNELWKRFNKEV